MSSTIIYLTHAQPLNARGRRKKDLLRVAANKLMGCISGVERDVNFTIVSSTAVTSNVGLYLNSACTAGISASGSGAVGMVINGTTITATWATSDTVSAGLVAAAINANTSSLVQYLVGATNLKSSLTLASVLAGTTINLAGFRFTAVAGTTETYENGDFVIGGTDTADGTSLCLAINRHPYANRFLFALNVAGVVHVFPKSAAWFTGPNAPPNKAGASAATITVGSATFAASDYYGVWCRHPGRFGNIITVAASGTGQTIENSNTRMTRGVGPDTLPVSDTL